ncbi:MAG: hypothetical protein LAP40_20410 [Acidobacteriia bacterium]|nr:hypothetical protein [Terriglobia bacterium]
MRSRTAARPAPKPPLPVKRRTAPSWFRPLLLVLVGIYLMGRFSGAAGDSDMWWHLAAGKYIWQNHRLPVPDPFAYTTNMGTPFYAGELTTRHFNLTHEWGMELIYYLVQSSLGFPGLVLFRALLLTVFCGMTGWLAWRRSGGFYRGVAASLVAIILASLFAADRAFLATFVLVTVTVAVFDTRRILWALPLIFLLWANLHGGYLMGWAIAGAYSAEALYLHFRGTPLPDERKIWMVSALSVLATVLNPNGVGVLEVMRHYRDSPMQLSITEWNYPAWWPPDYYNLLVAGTAVTLLWARRRVRVADWLLFIALGTASAMALRNVIFIAFIGPVLLATYLPAWKRPVWVIWEYAAAVLVVVSLAMGLSRGAMFQLRAAEWRYPAEAADFLIAHGVTGRIFNTYEGGGYLMWRLWPRQKVFIDGRALNESVWDDYVHIAFNADYKGGKTTNQLLEQYGIEVILMPGFDAKGQVYFLPAALADPVQKEWKLVFHDDKSLIYMRHPPPGVEALPSLEALDALEAQCNYNVDHGLPVKCAQALGEMFTSIRDWKRARKWLEAYLSVDSGNPKARGLLQQLNAAGRY